MQISRTRHKGENNNGKWRLGMQIDLMKRQGLGRSLFCSCTDDSPRLVLLHPRSDPYKLCWGGEREARERFKSLNIVHLPCPWLLLPKASHTSLESNPKTAPLSCRSHRAQVPSPTLWGCSCFQGSQGMLCPCCWSHSSKASPQMGLTLWGPPLLSTSPFTRLSLTTWIVFLSFSIPSPAQAAALGCGNGSHIPMEWLWNKILVLAGISNTPHSEGVTSHSLDTGS